MIKNTKYEYYRNKIIKTHNFKNIDTVFKSLSTLQCNLALDKLIYSI